jgi:simple sugar transport system permease protein
MRQISAQPKTLMKGPRALQSMIASSEFGPLVLLIAEFAVFGIIQPNFVSVSNISNLLAFTPELGFMALGMTLLMTAGEFDLSVGSVFGFSAVVMWTFYNQKIAPFGVSFLIAMAIAVLIGFVNGWFVNILKIPSFLVTLGMMLVVRGSALYITAGFPQAVWQANNPMANVLGGAFSIGDLRIQASVLWFVCIMIILHYVLTRARVGNWIQAAGGNPVAAQARGVRVVRTKTMLFVLTSVLSAFAGIASSIRVQTANPNSGTGYELEVIAMVVIGGTALTGGRGTIIGTVLGILILRSMRNGIVMIGVPGLAYNIFIGAIILGMMAVHSSLEARHHRGI